ncbi:MAG: nickel pincer cofactor biosynthesis protein LarC, partial [Oscillospiraceae bacterium]|nr:nickel pincer cofactor biosynthesis protein LarC [Oscillospiraceae bacterium]
EHEHGHGHEHHGHAHSGMAEIGALLAALPVSEAVRENARAVYGLIAEAESAVHGVPADTVHFHEVGALDAVADVTAVCLLMERLGAEKVFASPVHVGRGQVRCAHGILPVPAPATVHLLRGVPIYGRVEGELCTPTGAALLKRFVTSFGDMPLMTPEKIGCGMGKKDFEAANCVRAVLGEIADGAGDTAVELRCNLDDMTPEQVGFAAEQLLAQGALDVFTTAVGMKKSRPGLMLTVLCREADAGALLRAVFRHTSTLGVRTTVCRRAVLSRRTETLDTAFGPVRVKRAEGYGVSRCKPEYEDLARIARETGLSLDEVRRRLTGDGIPPR